MPVGCVGVCFPAIPIITGNKSFFPDFLNGKHDVIKFSVRGKSVFIGAINAISFPGTAVYFFKKNKVLRCFTTPRTFSTHHV